MPKKPVPEEKIPVPVAKEKEAPPAEGTVTYLEKKLKKKKKSPVYTSWVQNILVFNSLLI